MRRAVKIQMHNLSAILEWLTIYKGTKRKFLGFYQGVPTFSTDHFDKRLKERLPNSIQSILGISPTDFYEDAAKAYRKNSVSRRTKGAVDYSTNVKLPDGSTCTIHLSINFASDIITVGNSKVDTELNNMYSQSLKSTDDQERRRLLNQYVNSIKDTVDPQYAKLLLTNKMKLGDYGISILSIFGSVTTPEDRKAGISRNIIPSKDTRYTHKVQLKKKSLSKKDYDTLIKWSVNNVKQAVAKRSLDIKESTDGSITMGKD
ncbi:hypothetical protein LIS04_45 [Listeria phage LIS04]|nr:hypothetical protein LIS04_45 [Listeria phage LIS04]